MVATSSTAWLWFLSKSKSSVLLKRQNILSPRETGAEVSGGKDHWVGTSAAYEIGGHLFRLGVKEVHYGGATAFFCHVLLATGLLGWLIAPQIENVHGSCCRPTEHLSVHCQDAEVREAGPDASTS